MAHDSNNQLPLASWYSKHRTVHKSGIATERKRSECHRVLPLLLPSDRQGQFRIWSIGVSFRYPFLVSSVFIQKALPVGNTQSPAGQGTSDPSEDFSGTAVPWNGTVP